jgi:hypothetical protein
MKTKRSVTYIVLVVASVINREFVRDATIPTSTIACDVTIVTPVICIMIKLGDVMFTVQLVAIVMENCLAYVANVKIPTVSCRVTVRFALLVTNSRVT